jgi:hypothetical protein
VIIAGLDEVSDLASGLDAERHHLLAASQRVSSYRPEVHEFLPRGVARSVELARLVEVKRIFTGDEPGLPGQLAELWVAWAALANEPGALRARTEVLRRAAQVAETIRRMAADLAALEALEAREAATPTATVERAADDARPVAPGTSHFIAALDKLAGTLAGVLESIQAQGYDLRGSIGTAIFGGSCAADLKVRLLDPFRLAASALPQHTLDGSNALRVSRLATSRSGPDAVYHSVVAEIAELRLAARLGVVVQAAVSAGLEDLQMRMSNADDLDRATVLRTYLHALAAGGYTLPLIDDKIDCWLGPPDRAPVR